MRYDMTEKDWEEFWEDFPQRVILVNLPPDNNGTPLRNDDVGFIREMTSDYTWCWIHFPKYDCCYWVPKDYVERYKGSELL